MTHANNTKQGSSEVLQVSASPSANNPFGKALASSSNGVSSTVFLWAYVLLVSGFLGMFMCNILPNTIRTDILMEQVKTRGVQTPTIQEVTEQIAVRENKISTDQEIMDTWRAAVKRLATNSERKKADSVANVALLILYSFSVIYFFHYQF